jgi:hypothetical protein
MRAAVMRVAAMCGLVRFNGVLYRGMLAAYPPALRDRFGEEMVDAFVDDLTAEWRAGGWSGVVRVWCSAAREILSVAIPERLRDPALAGPAMSLAIHLTLAAAIVAIGAAFHEGIPAGVLHGLVTLRVHP